MNLRSNLAKTYIELHVDSPELSMHPNKSLCCINNNVEKFEIETTI